MYFKKYLIVIRENRNERNIEIRFTLAKKIFSDKIIFFKPKKETALKIGIERKKEVFAASTLLKFRSLAAVMAIPDLLTPGIKDKI